jgi:hypothetical protein
MQKLFVLLSILVFIIYWIITIVFTFPENYISITLSKESRLFHTFFFQRWGFFAPPPNYNERLYYTFVDTNGKSNSITYEVLEPLNLQNNKNNIFNYESDILDYVLSNSLSNITETINEVNKVYEFEKNTKSNSDSAHAQMLSDIVIKSPQFMTIKNYAKYVASKNNISPNFKHVVITLTIIPLPKFYQRLDKILVDEKIIFRSDETPM